MLLISAVISAIGFGYLIGFYVAHLIYKKLGELHSDPVIAIVLLVIQFTILFFHIPQIMHLLQN